MNDVELNRVRFLLALQDVSGGPDLWVDVGFAEHTLGIKREWFEATEITQDVGRSYLIPQWRLTRAGDLVVRADGLANLVGHTLWESLPESNCANDNSQSV